MMIYATYEMNPSRPSGATEGTWQNVPYINGLVLERRNSIVNALELCLPCTYPLILSVFIMQDLLKFETNRYYIL